MELCRRGIRLDSLKGGSIFWIADPIEITPGYFRISRCIYMEQGGKGVTVSFCGHSEIIQPEGVRCWLMHTVESLIAKGADTFYLGGRGAFDSLAAHVLWEQKKTYSHIQIILVLAYLNRNMDTLGYDATLYPELESVPPRYAISRRNEYMVEMADVVVAYVIHDWGGAAKTLEYARRKGKMICCFNDG